MNVKRKFYIADEPISRVNVSRKSCRDGGECLEKIKKNSTQNMTVALRYREGESGPHKRNTTAIQEKNSRIAVVL